MTTCPLCESSRLRVEEVEKDYELLDKDLRRERKVSAALRGQLADKHRDAPNAATVLEVIEYWIAACRPTTGHLIKVSTEGKRADAVRKALKDWSPEQLRQAIDGLARKPYVWAGADGRVKRQRFGLKEQRADELQTALASPENVERFIGYALEEVPDERLVQIPQRALDRMHARVLSAERCALAFREQAWGSMVMEHMATLRWCWLDGEETGGYEAQLRESCPAALEGWAAFKRTHPRGQLRVLEGGRSAA